MRVTQDYSIQALLRQVESTRNRINTHQRNLATGKRVNQISDDPANIESILRFKNMLDTNTRYSENINNASEILDLRLKRTDRICRHFGNSQGTCHTGS